MTDAEKLLNKKKVYKNEMDRVLPKEQSDRIWKQAAIRLGTIMKEHESVPDGVRMHANKIFPSAAVYLSLKEELDSEKAYGIMERPLMTHADPLPENWLRF